MSIVDRLIDWIVAAYSFDGFFKAWAAVVLVCVLLHIAERLFPAQRNQPYRSMITNGLITLVYALLGPIGRFGALFIVGYILSKLASDLPTLSLYIHLNKLAKTQIEPIRSALLVLIAFVPLLAYDFFYYWFHRLQHANSWLWEQHKLHHSDQALNVTTAFRINWLEDFFKALLVSVPMGLVLGIPPTQVGLLTSVAGAVGQIWGQYLHSNIRISLGVLTPFIAGPQFHRIHHSLEAHHQNRNFSTYLPIWDRLFGTYCRPSENEYPQTGVPGEPSNPSLREIFVGPIIRWVARLLRLNSFAKNP